MEDRICDLEADLRTMSRLKPVAAVNYIRKVIGYDDYLRSYAEFRRMKPEELFETADKLAESAAEFETFGGLEGTCGAVRGRVEKAESRRDQGSERPGDTVHDAQREGAGISGGVRGGCE